MSDTALPPASRVSGLFSEIATGLKSTSDLFYLLQEFLQNKNGAG